MATSVWQNPISAHPTPFSGIACVPDAVAAQAILRPEAVAITAGARHMTYGELDRRANSLARKLASLGVRAGVPVGLCLPRSVEMVIAALGVWKAGGAYLPMDPAYPSSRLAMMLLDAQAPVLVTNADLARSLPAAGRAVVTLDDAQTPGEIEQASQRRMTVNDLAYVIYTSGSTGLPKGVEIPHASLANLVSWHCRAFVVTPADHASHVAGLGFDAAVWELWPYLAAGARVHLAEDAVRSSPELLRDWLLEQGITISFVPTPIAERLIALEWPRETALRILLTGGDMLGHYPHPTLPFRLVNNYGPTECTVVATSGDILPDADPEILPSIGRAIDGTRVYLLNEYLDPVDAGTPGEIFLGGAGVGRGYRNQPELTATKFVRDPFSDEPGARMYKTGDLARLLPDGQLTFLGRTDDQIKIRGYRIEPGEVMMALSRHPEIRESLVMAREDKPGDRQLVAYIVVKTSAGVLHTALRDFLRETLPDYMIPAAFVRVNEFPLTPHGKVDRDALPPPEFATSLPDAVSSAQHSSPTQRRIAGIVAGLLGLESVGPDDNFFLLGGHSLLGAQLIAKLRAAFDLQISLRSLFAAPTVAALAREVERLAGAKPGGTQK